jgi:hypothetical protein
MRDLPELVTDGHTPAEAALMAEDALSVVLSLYIGRKRPISAPTPVQPGERLVFALALFAVKVGRYGAMRERSIGKAERPRQPRPSATLQAAADPNPLGGKRLWRLSKLILGLHLSKRVL